MGKVAYLKALNYSIFQSPWYPKCVVLILGSKPPSLTKTPCAFWSTYQTPTHHSRDKIGLYCKQFYFFKISIYFWVLGLRVKHWLKILIDKNFLELKLALKAKRLIFLSERNYLFFINKGKTQFDFSKYMQGEDFHPALRDLRH